LAAQEFFGGDRNWRSLPKRVRRLCDVLEAWVRKSVYGMEWVKLILFVDYLL
jgi:hypothetical protein